MSYKIFISAGEESGDILGADLMKALKERHDGPILFTGIGGARMEAEGLKSIFPMQELSVMGIFEVLPKLFHILKRIKQTANHIIQKKPDIVITIDAPDFSFRVAKRIVEKAKDKPKMVHYVAPTVWAWREERAQKVAYLYDLILCLFPMEPPYFEAHGMDAKFIGHPMLKNLPDNKESSDKAFRKKHHIPDDAKIFGLLFGSRKRELTKIGSNICETAKKVVNSMNDNIHIVSLTLPHLRQDVQNMLADMNCPVHIIDDAGQKWDTFNAMDYAIATSGTVGLELTISDVPHIMAYKMHPLTAAIIRRKIKIPYGHLSNILLNDFLVPEFIQKQCAPDLMVPALQNLIGSEDAKKAQKAGAVKIRKMLRDTKQPPSLVASDEILALLK